jgi:hypothetical protein
MKNRTIVCMVLIVLLSSSCAVRPSQVIKTGPPSEWNALPDHVSEEVEVQLEKGDKVKGMMTAVTDRDVTVEQRRLHRDQVQRVHVMQRDPINDGMLIGLVTGAAGGFLALYLRHHNSSSAPHATEFLGGLLGAVGGLILGGLIDRAHNPGRELIYQKR